MKLNQYDTTTGKTTSITVSDTVFGAVMNDVLLSQALRVYQSNQRQGTSKVKTRSEINRTKHKWFKQKGTGNARHGARTPNIFVGGGVSHGPNGMQNWHKDLSQDMKHKALITALSAQAANTVVHTGLNDLPAKTKAAAQLIAQVTDAQTRVLVIIDQTKLDVVKAIRNLPNVLLMTASRVTAFEVALADKIVMSPEAITVLENRVSGKKEVKAVKEVKTEAVAKKEVKPAVKPAAKPAAKPAVKPAAKKTAAPTKTKAPAAPKKVTAKAKK